jgi:hypothetical protein
VLSFLPLACVAVLSLLCVYLFVLYLVFPCRVSVSWLFIACLFLQLSLSRVCLYLSHVTFVASFMPWSSLASPSLCHCLGFVISLPRVSSRLKESLWPSFFVLVTRNFRRASVFSCLFPSSYCASSYCAFISCFCVFGATGPPNTFLLPSFLARPPGPPSWTWSWSWP